MDGSQCWNCIDDKWFVHAVCIRCAKLLLVQTEVLSCRFDRTLKEICFDCGVIQLLGRHARDPRSSWTYSSHFLTLTHSLPIRCVAVHLVCFTEIKLAVAWFMLNWFMLQYLGHCIFRFLLHRNIGNQARSLWEQSLGFWTTVRKELQVAHWAQPVRHSGSCLAVSASHQETLIRVSTLVLQKMDTF